MKLPQIKNTRLEIIPKEEIISLLDAKIEEFKEKNLPVEESLTDYIALGFTNIDEEIEKLKNYKKMLDEKIKELTIKKQEISEEVANYLENNLGVDKLKGVIVSSITIKPEREKITKKFVLDVDKEALIELGVAHYEETKTISPKQIKINKRKNNAKSEYLSEIK